MAFDADGTNFGTAALNGAGPSRTFTVWNTGTAAMTITTVAMPTGFVLTEGLSTPIAAGASDTFTVRLNTATAGLFTGDITINNTAYRIRVLGVVAPPTMSLTSGGVAIAANDLVSSPADNTDFGAFAVAPWKGVDINFAGTYDSGTTLVDPTNSQILYHTLPTTIIVGGVPTRQASFIRRSANGGATWTTIVSGIPTVPFDNANLLPPLVMDPADPTHLFVATDKIYESTNSGTSWAPIPLPAQWSADTPVDALAVAAGGNILVASQVDPTLGSEIWVTTNQGATWNVWRPGGIDTPWTSLLIDPSDPAIMYAGSPSFNVDNGNMRLMRTSNSGAGWSNIGGGLPDSPLRAIELSTNAFGADDDVLYVGTDLGVYQSQDLGGAWEKLGSGLPSVSVRDLEFSPNRRTLYAATAGRGVWAIPVHVLTMIDGTFAPPSAVEGTPWGAPTAVFSFTDTNIAATADEYTAIITWGDGSVSTITNIASADGQIVARPGGGFDVLAAHLYTEHIVNGLFVVRVFNSVSQTSASDAAFNVADAPLTPGAFSTIASVTEGAQIYDQLLFRFTDGNPYGLATDFTATIDWGDGTTFAATSSTSAGSQQTPLVDGGRVVATPGGPAGSFDVYGTHMYVDSEVGNTITVSVLDIGGASTSGASQAFDVAEAALTPGLAWYPYAKVGQSFSQQLVFSFTDANSYATGDYQATIYWGDGTTSVVSTTPTAAGQIVRRAGSANEWQVRGGHTYYDLVTDGEFKVEVHDDNLTCSSATIVFSLGTPQLTLGSLTLPAAVERVPFTELPLLRIADNMPSASVDDYTAVITWGDGTTSTINKDASPAGRIVAVDPNDPAAGFFILGSHTYAQQIPIATFSVQVSSSRTGLSGTATSNTFTVKDSPLVDSALTPPVGAVEGFLTPDAKLFHFAELYPDLSGASLGQFKATIHWGDGTFSTVSAVASADGYITANPSGGYDVYGSHLYRDSLVNAAFSVSVIDLVETAELGVSDFSVAEGVLTAGALTPPSATAGVPLHNVLLFHFSDANPHATPSDYVATIAWGDGTTAVSTDPLPDGQIVVNASGGFDVLGSHTYADAFSNRTFSVQVVDDSVSVGASVSTFSVSPGAVDVVGGFVVDARHGEPFAGQVVATFTNPGNEPPANFTATINWNDGQESAGVITLADGVYTVTGSHTYAADTAAMSLQIFITVSHGAVAPTTVASIVKFQDGFTPGLYDPVTSKFYLRNSNSEGAPDAEFGFGAPGAGWKPVAGDWDGDGKYTIGLYDPSTSYFYLRNTNSAGPADETFGYGDPTAGNRYALVMGDWNADGVTTVGLYDRLTAQWYLRNSNSTGIADISFGYGEPGSSWSPIVGDWDGDGVTTIGFYDTANAIYYLRDSNTTGVADYTFGYGVPGSTWTPIMGDWDDNQTSTIGFYDQASSHWYLRNSNTVGMSDVDFGFGAPGAGWLPIVGDWVGPAAAPLLALGDAAAVATASLTEAQLQPIVAAAIDRWAEAGVDAGVLADMRQAHVVIADLAGSRLGETLPGTVRIDLNAAGRGWFVDATPADDDEFVSGRAVDAQAVDRIDLLTVVEHELGHLAGLDDLELATDGLMSAAVGVGVRRLPGQAEADSLFGDNEW